MNQDKEPTQDKVTDRIELRHHDLKDKELTVLLNTLLAVWWEYRDVHDDPAEDAMIAGILEDCPFLAVIDSFSGLEDIHVETIYDRTKVTMAARIPHVVKA